MAQSISDMSVTWPDGSTYNGIKLNVNDAGPSSASSLLMDLQVGGESRFKTDKDGQATFTVKNTGGTPTLSVVKSGSASIALTASTAFGINVLASSLALNANNGGSPIWADSSYFNFGSVANNDVRLYRDGAANTLAQRNGANGQAFRIYNNFSTSSDFDRGFIRWNANVLKIGTEVGGTFTTGRDIELSTASGRYLRLANTTTLDTNAVYIRFYDGATSTVNIKVGTGLHLGSDKAVLFTSGLDSFGTAADAGLARSAAAKVVITNGSTGAGSLVFRDAGNIETGTTTGTKIGTATTQKLGFFDKTPVVQPTAVADATSGSEAIDQLNALLSRLRDLGLIAT